MLNTTMKFWLFVYHCKTKIFLSIELSMSCHSISSLLYVECEVVNINTCDQSVFF